MSIQEWLVDYLCTGGAVAGTVHQQEGDGLRLCAASNIPERIKAVVRWVPRGKGMAGLALESGEPVQTCNLKEDSSGQVRPGAKAVNAGAAIAIPVRDSQGAIAAVVGVAFAEEREIPQAEVSRLSNEAATLIPLLVPQSRWVESKIAQRVKCWETHPNEEQHGVGLNSPCGSPKNACGPNARVSVAIATGFGRPSETECEARNVVLHGGRPALLTCALT